MNLKVFVANLLGRHVLCNGFGLGGRSVLIRAAHVQGHIAAETREPGKDVGGQDTADDVAQVRYVVDVGQGRGDQNVLPVCLR